MSDVKSGLPDHTMALLGYLLDGLRHDVLARMSGRDDGRPPLRGSQLRLLSLTPAEGMRVTDLAQRVGMTKQSLGEFAGVLEELGLLETVRDPSDRRVRILRPTARGRAVVALSDITIAEVEAGWSERFGPERWQTLRTLLAEAADLGSVSG